MSGKVLNGPLGKRGSNDSFPEANIRIIVRLECYYNDVNMMFPGNRQRDRRGRSIGFPTTGKSSTRGSERNQSRTCGPALYFYIKLPLLAYITSSLGI